MKLWPVRTPIAGQSRPNGFHLERIPVHEDDPGAKQLDGTPDRIDEQFAALRKIIASLGVQLEEVKEDRNRLAEVSAKRLNHIRALDARLAAARHVMHGCGVGPALLATFQSPKEFGEGWRREQPVTARPDRC